MKGRMFDKPGERVWTSFVCVVRSGVMMPRRFILLTAALFLLAAPRLALSSTIYVVQKGDAINRIAKRFLVSPEQIRVENGLKSNKIRVGDTLRIPEKNEAARIENPPRSEQAVHPQDKPKTVETSRTSPLRLDPSVDQKDKPEAVETARADSQSQPADVAVVDVSVGPAQMHVVRQGDTFWSLSRRYGVSESDLRRLNNLPEGKTLRIGARLLVQEHLPEAYTVKEGDLLLNIARKFGVETEGLCVRSDLDSDALALGQRLGRFGRKEKAETVEIVRADSQSRLTDAAAVDASIGPAQIHVVCQGDTLWSLSRRYGVSESELRRLNPLQEGKKALRIGARILVREHLPETYTVREGDSLIEIARKFGVETKELYVRNDLDSDVLAPGQQLVLFGQKDKPKAVKTPHASPPRSEQAVDPQDKLETVEIVRADSQSQPANAAAVRAFVGPAQTHIVRQGDTLWSLSRRYGVPESELRRLNPLQEGKKVLRVGTRILIREYLPETYTVRKGDSLIEIARKFGMKAEEIGARNDLDSVVLVPGQRLVLFDREDESEPADIVSETRSVATEEELAAAALPQSLPEGDVRESIPARIARVAKKMLFVPYVWGGTSLTGVDCSGFVWKVFSLLDLQLPRSAREQYKVGKEVGRDKLSIGDLVFFRTYAKYPSHVGIYLGDNQFIHASSGSRHVKINSLDHPYYVKRYIGAKRLLFGEDSGVH